VSGQAESSESGDDDASDNHARAMIMKAFVQAAEPSIPRLREKWAIWGASSLCRIFISTPATRPRSTPAIPRTVISYHHFNFGGPWDLFDLLRRRCPACLSEPAPVGP
jgi:hypothetical protein